MWAVIPASFTLLRIAASVLLESAPPINASSTSLIAASVPPLVFTGTISSLAERAQESERQHAQGIKFTPPIPPLVSAME